MSDSQPEPGSEEQSSDLSPPGQPLPASQQQEPPLVLEPAPDGGTASPPDTHAPSDPGSFGRVLALVAIVALGLVLRWRHAEALEGVVFEWEADGFISAWEGQPWGGWNRLRPPGVGWAYARVAEQYGLQTTHAIRLACIALSLVGLLAAWELGRSVSRRGRLGRRSLTRCAVWAGLVWAVHPTLIRSSVSPTPELLVGPALCLLLSALIARRERRGPLAWALAVALVALASVVSGVVFLIAFAIGLIVYLIPVPRFSITAAGSAMLLAGVAALYAAQRGPEPGERVVLPDLAGVHSVMALAGIDPPHPNDLPAHADRRELLMLQTAQDGIARTPVLDLGTALLGRLLADVWGPARLQPLLDHGPVPLASDANGRAARMSLGLFDVFIRGGLLIFGFAVVGLLGRGVAKGESLSRLPRAGVVVGLIALALLSALTAMGPLSAAPLDLVLLGAAAGGVAGTDPRKGWTRRLAFTVGGVLTCSFLYTLGWNDRPLTDWGERLSHLSMEGSSLVGLLDAPDPNDVEREKRIANLLMQPRAPLLRRPEAALVHAQQTLQLSPLDDRAGELNVRALVEQARYAEAAHFAEVLLGSQSGDGMSARTFSLLLEWVRQEERLAKGLAPGR